MARSTGRPAAELTATAREALLRYSWPGNVRELHNALERAAIVCDANLIQPADLELIDRPGTPARTSTSPIGNLTAVERQMIAKALEEAHWNKSTAAKRLGLTRTQLYVRIRKHGLEPAAIVNG